MTKTPLYQRLSAALDRARRLYRVAERQQFPITARRRRYVRMHRIEVELRAVARLGAVAGR